MDGLKRGNGQSKSTSQPNVSRNVSHDKGRQKLTPSENVVRRTPQHPTQHPVAVAAVSLDSSLVYATTAKYLLQQGDQWFCRRLSSGVCYGRYRSASRSHCCYLECECLQIRLCTHVSSARATISPRKKNLVVHIFVCTDDVNIVTNMPTLRFMANRTSEGI